MPLWPAVSKEIPGFNTEPLYSFTKSKKTILKVATQ